MLIHNTTFLGELLTEKNLFDLSFFEIFTSNDSNLFIGGRGGGGVQGGAPQGVLLC
jgi:hypothetical protein